MPYFIEHNAGNGYVETAGRAVAADPLCLSKRSDTENEMPKDTITGNPPVAQDVRTHPTPRQIKRAIVSALLDDLRNPETPDVPSHVMRMMFDAVDSAGVQQ